MNLSLERNRPCATLLFALALAGCSPSDSGPESQPGPAPITQGSPPVPTDAATVTVRYQVADVARSVTFYTERLGFQLAGGQSAAFAAVWRGNLLLILSGPGASGSRPLPDGRRQEPGGWNRIVLYVDDLAGRADSLAKAGVLFRNGIEVGPGGSQAMLEDPDGNPIELHEAPAAPAP
ncbi:MAG TPA: VOC family protein [Polyangiaceae bacterium]|nr:VOC family protein [Polyangiaceae bacterium]